MIKLLNKNTDLQINKFHFFKLSEWFVEKQMLQRIFLQEKLILELRYLLNIYKRW